MDMITRSEPADAGDMEYFLNDYFLDDDGDWYKRLSDEEPLYLSIYKHKIMYFATKSIGGYFGGIQSLIRI